jgi:hypothetical protein
VTSVCRLLAWLVVLCIMLCCRGKLKKTYAKQKSKRLERKFTSLSFSLGIIDDEEDAEPVKKRKLKVKVKKIKRKVRQSAETDALSPDQCTDIPLPTRCPPPHIVQER